MLEFIVQLRLLHYVPRISKEASGLTGSVPPLCSELASIGYDVDIICLEAGTPIAGVNLRSFPELPLFQSFGFAPSLIVALWRDLNSFDLVHNHSLWTMPNIVIGWIVPRSNAKLVISPHGTLSPWALSVRSILKKLLWPLQKYSFCRADMLHATSEVEMAQIRDLGFNGPVALIPLGIRLPKLLGARPEKLDGQRTLFFLSRLHPIKGIDILLNCWKTLEKKHPAWRLVIAGDGERDYVEQVYVKASKLQLSRVEFLGGLYGDVKDEAYQAADLFVLPSHSENFGLVVAEALASGCPAIVSRAAPWAGLERERCGWWVDNEVGAFSVALDQAMQLTQGELRLMGLRGRAWMARDFSWPASAKKMGEAYRWLLTGGVCPEWVKL